MADSEDLKRLHSGEYDLSRCDFREADLSGMDLRGRDFSKALLKKAVCKGTDFRECNFIGAEMSFMDAQEAKFDLCNLQNQHFGYCDYRGASFVRAKGDRARFQNTNLSGADLTGASFVNGEMNADTKLQGVVADNSTDFEGLAVLRPTSRDALFSGYQFENGRLRRIEPSDSAPDHNVRPSNDVPNSVVNSVPSVPAADRLVRLDHNQPEYQEVARGLDELFEHVRQDNQIGETAEERDRLLQSLGAARQLWSAAELYLLQIRVGVVMAIEDTTSAAAKVGKAVAGALLVDLIKRFLKQTTGVEL